MDGRERDRPADRDQYEPAFARAATRALKIRERLGDKGGIDDLFPAKPKGMHWKTYEQLRDEAERLEGVWARGIAGRFRLDKKRRGPGYSKEGSDQRMRFPSRPANT
jgi:hypothetical protein